MDTSKIIKGVVNSGRYTVTAPIVKEDYGLYLQIEGVELPSTYQVDFSNSEHNGTSVTMIGNSDGVLIPAQLISSGKDVFAFLYHVGADYGRTVYKFRIPNKVRPDRTDETPTPEQASTIDQTIAALNDAVESAQDAQEAIEDMSVSATTLAEGASATVTKTESGGVVHLDFGIPVGATGAQGERGDKGDKGDKGDTGATGAKGEQGERGLTGQDGISPTVTITPITGGHRITIIDKDGEHSADVMDGTGNVDDVQINGTSIVTDGVANVPISNTSKLGVVKQKNGFGIAIDSAGQIYTQKGSATDVKLGTHNYNSITPSNQHEAAFYGLAKAAGDTTQSQSSNAVGNYTEEAKSAIQDMIGIDEWKLVAEETLAEDGAFDITIANPAREVYLYIEVEAAASTTSLVVGAFNDAGTRAYYQTFSGQINTSKKYTIVQLIPIATEIKALAYYGKDVYANSGHFDWQHKSFNVGKLNRFTITAYGGNILIPTGSIVRIFTR